MKHVFFAIPLASILAVTAACGGDAAVDDDATSSGAPSSSGAVSSSSSSGGSSSSSGSTSSSSSSGALPFECEETPFVFPVDASPVVAAATYEDYLAIDEQFPFDVVGFYSLPAGLDAAGSEWGEHGGPVAYGNDDGDVVVHRLSAPAGATGALSDDSMVLAAPADRFDPAYANYPPAASLPGNRYLLSYTSTGVDGVIPGLGYLYAGNVLQQRAHANGLFGALGADRGDTLRVFYHAYSPFAAEQPDTNTGGLYVTDVAGTELVGASARSFALALTGTDSGGPVVRDGSGNVLLATQGALVNLRALSRCGALVATAPLELAPFHTYDTAGTDALAVVPPAAGLPGYVVHVSYPAPSQEILATPFTRSGETFAAAGEDLAAPLVAGTDTTSIGAFTDPQGYLWVGLSTDQGGYVAKLRRRPD